MSFTYTKTIGPLHYFRVNNVVRIDLFGFTIYQQVGEVSQLFGVSFI